MTLSHFQKEERKNPMFGTIAHIKATAKEAGSHWFDRNTMRFFNTRILNGVIQGQYFVTSEAYKAEGPRRFTVRKAELDGNIKTMGQFQEFSTAAEARAYARTLPFGEYPK